MDIPTFAENGRQSVGKKLQLTTKIWDDLHMLLGESKFRRPLTKKKRVLSLFLLRLKFSYYLIVFSGKVISDPLKSESEFESV